MIDKIRLVDVGARGGVDPRWKPYLDILEVLAFEPDPEECAALNSKPYPYSIRFLPEALGANDDERATLYICSKRGCSSLLRPNKQLIDKYPYGEGWDVVGEYPVTLKRLDSACGDFRPDVLKVDTQGTELNVMRGAGRLLDDTLAVELEVAFAPVYIGQAFFSDVDFFMSRQGFTLRGLRRTCWREKADYRHAFGGQIIHGDALYLRLERMDCEKGHLILAAYRQYDLLARFGASHLIPRESWLMRSLSRALSRIPNRDLRRFVDRLCPKSATDWHDPDFF